MKELTHLFMHRQNSGTGKNRSELFCRLHMLLMAIPIIVLSFTGCMTLSSSDCLTNTTRMVTKPCGTDDLKRVKTGNKAHEQVNEIRHDSSSQLISLKNTFLGFVHQLRENHRQCSEILSKNSVLEEIIGSLMIEFDLLKKVYQQVSGIRGALLQDFQQAKSEFGEIADFNSDLRKKLIRIQNNSVTVEDRIDGKIIESEKLAERLIAATDQIKKTKGQKNLLSGTCSRFENQLSMLKTEHRNVEKESILLGARVDDLRQQTMDLNDAQRKLVSQLNKRVTSYLDDFEKALTVTGFDVSALLTGKDIPSSDHHPARAAGGPFIAYFPAPGKGPACNSQMGRIDSMLADLGDHVGKWEVFHQLLRRMPLSFPVEEFKITSKFGKRRDPINGRPAMHYGIDLNNDAKPPVLATAPGIVTVAGWNPYYGGMVEINHGFGISSRYGHLRKVLVKRGQKVDFHQMIGRMGSTGRSTGPHVHYEITIKGIPQDPLKFINTGRYCIKRISKSIKKFITSPTL